MGKLRAFFKREGIGKSVALVLSISVAVMCAGKLYLEHRVDEEKARLGRQAVALLYNFKSIQQLDGQMTGLYNITTEEVYNQLTIDNEGRTLNTYIQFNCGSCEVNVLESGTEFVIYSLKASSGSPKEDEIFVFLYNVNKDGKICWVKEMEGYEFTDTINYQGFDF